jgi:muramoyltetrapeptide carboxypeptidase
MMIKPPLLKPGDTIAIVAPARRVDPKQIASAIKSFESWGLRVLTGKNLYSNSHHYLAGSDEERLLDLQNFLDDPTVNAIISARGGYGSTRIVDLLNFNSLTKNPKWIVGFSDITAVHLKLAKHGLISLHGTMPILFDREDSALSVQSLWHTLTTGSFSLKANPNPHNRNGTASGKLIGGNLSLIVDALGTSSEPDTENAILIIEEIDEYFYRIDRMMTHLKRAGKLKCLKGLAVGHFTAIKESELQFQESVEQIILNSVREYNYPVAFNLPSGHENPNFSWIQGENAEMSVSTHNTHLSSMHSS